MSDQDDEADAGAAAPLSSDDEPPADSGEAPARDGKSRVRRPRPVRRRKWTTVYASDEERAIISGRAAAANLKASPYLVACGMRDQVVVRADWRSAVARLTEVSARLAEISQRLDGRVAPLDAVQLHLDLCRIEAAARGILTPMQQSIVRAAHALNLADLLAASDDAGDGHEFLSGNTKDVNEIDDLPATAGAPIAPAVESARSPRPLGGNSTQPEDGG